MKRLCSSKTVFALSIPALFLTMLNALVHFQWAVTVWPDVLLCCGVTLIGFVTMTDLSFPKLATGKWVCFLRKASPALIVIGTLGQLQHIIWEDCGVPALIGGLVMTAVSAIYLYRGDSITDSQTSHNLKARRIVCLSVFGFICFFCVVTPTAVVAGTRMGYAIEGQVEEVRCPFETAMFPCTEGGTLELLEYETPLYDNDGNPTDRVLSKRAWVYLPDGYYDEENAQKQYDVLYLSHGATYDENHFFKSIIPGYSKYRNFFDHMIAQGRIRPVIVVTPCIYTKDDTLDATCDLTLIYQYELRNHIVPEVEGNYRTYAENTTPEALEASRDHRAFGGYSMGSMTTELVFIKNLDYFANFFPMSVGFGSAERFVDALENTYQGKYDADDYVIAMSTGGRDGAYSSMVDQYYDMKNYPEYFIDDPTLENGNVCIYIGTNHRHGSEFVLEYLYALLTMVWPAE